jgi:NADPH:quinone reductase-like Zn-dependent oxidoreductase
VFGWLPYAKELPMKAIVYYQYGSPDVVQLREVDRPLGRDDGVIVKVRAAAANPYDWHFMRGEVR